MTQPVMPDKDLECTDKRPPGDAKIYIHSLIGIAIMIIFQFLPAYAGITEVGMKCVGAFLGMVYLWSTVGSLWPSLLGLVFIGLSGFSGPGLKGFNQMILDAFGNHTVLLTLFAMVLFGALYEVGCTEYIAMWFLTRKVVTGRPYVFIFIFYLACMVLSWMISPIGSLIMLWPITISLMNRLGVERCDSIWSYFFVGMFFVSTLAQPFFPFMGAQLVVVSAFEKMSGSTVAYGPYMALNGLMTLFITIVYLLIVKFVLRPDTSKFKAIDAEDIKRSNPMPPMNGLQKIYLIMIPLYVAMLLAPSFLDKKLPIISTLAALGPCGVTLAWIVLFCVLRYNGKPFLDFKEVAYKQFNWGIFFMIAAAVYGANSLSHDSTGVKTFLVNFLQPILGGKSEIVFVAILFTVALIITNFANNAAMAVVLMPVILAFSEQMNLNPLPIAMGVGMMVFVAMLTPAASPHSGMMWGRTDLYSTGDILRIGLPACIITLLIYIFIGYPLAKIFFA